MIRFVRGFLPAQVVTTTTPFNGRGRQEMWRAIIMAGDESDVGMVNHELVHVGQWYDLLFACLILAGIVGVLTGVLVLTLPFGLVAGLFLHGKLYTYVRGYRLWAEVQAFREQIKWYADSDVQAHYFARWLAVDGPYNVGITEGDAYRRITA